VSVESRPLVLASLRACGPLPNLRSKAASLRSARRWGCHQGRAREGGCGWRRCCASGAAELTETLDIAIGTAKNAPKYLISDKGSQFQEDYQDWCDARGIKPRFGAIGQHGSVAVVERFIRTLKQECVRRIVVPLATEAFERELLTYVGWFNEHRPHRTLAGRTPNEVHEGRAAARELPRIETRQEPKGRRVGATEIQSHARQVTQLRLVIKHFEDRKRLPVIEMDRAA
jgi:transposase InsO family protein